MAKNAKYFQVADWMREQILSGEMCPGDKLESENDICSRFDVSRQTVRHALGLLSEKGLLESRKGSGWFVSGSVKSPEKKTVSSRTVVIVSTYLNGYIFPNVIQGMEKVLETDDWNIQIMFTYNQKETEEKILKKLLEDSDAAGLIIEPAMSGLPNPNKRYYKQLQEKGVPVLFFHSYYPELSIPHVSMDDVGDGKMLVDYLVKMGHTEIGGIFKLDDGQGIRRFEGYQNGLHEHGLCSMEKHMVWIDTEDQHHMELCKERILSRISGCTACVCYNDEVAHALTEICIQEGIRIPEELSVVSVDNSALAGLNPVPLTSIRHPMEALGAKTAEHMLRMIRQEKFDPTYEFPPELEIRESVKNLGCSGTEQLRFSKNKK